MTKETYDLIENYMLSCMEDSAHDKEHIYRVLFNALEIAKVENDIDYDVLITACLLHDIGRREQFDNPALCHAIDGSSLVIKSKKKEEELYSSSFFFGPSGEIRTPGILNPKTEGNFFLTFSAPFGGVHSSIRCFPELFSPLLPGVRIRSMVKNVVNAPACRKTRAF